MNLLVIQILAVGLTLSQLFTRPVEQFRTQFNPQTEQGLVAQILKEGCAQTQKDLKLDKIDLTDFFNMVQENMKAAKEREDAAKGDGGDNLSFAEDVQTAKVGVTSFLDRLDFPQMASAYQTFCGSKTLDESVIRLSEVIEYFNKTLADLPDHMKLKGHKLPGSTVVLDNKGTRFTEIYTDNNRRHWVALEQLPPWVPKAFVSAEDKRFFQHKGLDIRGVVRALITSMSSRKRPEGGSTITQQVAKNLFTGDDVTIERKMREMVLAARMEKDFTKNEILEFYINQAYFGRSSWGIDMAARSYFGKSARQLTLSETADLVSLVRGPGKYSPDLHPDLLEQRRMYVLSRVKEDHPDDGLDMKALSKDKPEVIAWASPRTRASFYFLDEVIRDARRTAKIKSLTAESYTVRTTIDPEMQKLAEASLQDGLAEYEEKAGRGGSIEVEGSLAEEIRRLKDTWQEALPKRHGRLWDVTWPLATVIEKKGSTVKVGLADGRVATLINAGPNLRAYLKIYDLIRVKLNEGKTLTATLRTRPQVQGAVIVLEAQTGRVLADVGGFSYAQSQLNRTTRMTRQVGSALKPFIYLSALNLGFQPNTLIPNVPVHLEPIDRGGKWYSPHNYDRESGGLVTIRQAVEQSLNLPTVRITSELGRNHTDGLDYIAGITQELGIYEKPVRYYPFVLGAQPTRLIDMAVAYATIANSANPHLNGAFKPTPHFIDAIEQDGNLVWARERLALKPTPSIDRTAFFQIRHILEGTVARGTATRLKDLTGYVAGKTGTTNNAHDAWFVGFTNDLVVATWVGYDSDKVRASLGDRFTGGAVALPIAERVIRGSFKIYKDKEALFGMPPDVVTQAMILPIDVYTGRVNAGNYPEVFRLARPGVPADTVGQLLSQNEQQLGVNPQPIGDEYEQGYEMADLSGVPGFQPHDEDASDAYRPGYDDENEMWARRNRRVDGLLANPFQGSQ